MRKKSTPLPSSPGVLCLLLIFATTAPALMAVAVAQTTPMSAPQHPVERPVVPHYADKNRGSTYTPMDSWMYPALERLQALGYLDTAFIGLRPWTRLSVAHMLEASDRDIQSGKGTASDEARMIFAAVASELFPDETETHSRADLDTVYTRFVGLTDTPPVDSYHLGQTILNDYGRPYQAGVNQ